MSFFDLPEMFTIQFEDRNEFNQATDIIQLSNDVEIGYSDMILIFEDEVEKDYVIECLVDEFHSWKEGRF